MSTKTAKTTKKPTLSIPSADRSSKASLNPADILNKFKKVAAAPTPKAKKARPEMELTDEATEAFRRFAKVKCLYDLVDAKREVSDAEVKSLLWDIFAETIWQHKSQPENPRIKIATADGKADIESMYVMQEKMKINMPPVEDGQDPENVLIVALAEAFIEIGIDEKEAVEDATNLVKSEIDFTPSLTIDLTALLVGDKNFQPNDLQKAVVSKFLTWQTEGGNLELSDEEREGLPVNTKHNAVVKDGFLERVCTYAHSLEQLSIILKIIKPTPLIRGTEICLSDPGSKAGRLLDEAKDILGVE